MLVVFPTHDGDCHLLEELLLWIEKLDPKLHHDALLVFDRDTSYEAASRCHAIAYRIFRKVTVTATRQSVRGWPHGCNSLFFHAAKHVYDNWRVPFLLMEPDAIPLRSGWLDEISIAYLESGMEHIGSIENVTNAGLPPRVMSGVAVYGPDVGTIPPLCVRAWNTDLADLLVPKAAHTNLIHDFFGQKDMPPIFVEERREGDAANVVTLDFVRRDAVIFHRDKTHALMPLLAKKLNIPWRKKAQRIVVVFPVCHRDVQLALFHAHWLANLGKSKHRALIAFDPTCPSALVHQLRSLLERAFAGVDIFRYAKPPINEYPQVANWCFQSVAFRMANQSAPWLFLEPDTVVLRADWLDKLQEEYEIGGKSWMGPHVQGMSHANGVMVYPPDASTRMPHAMACGAGQAFDMEAAADIMHDCHDCNHLLFHAWTILNNEWHPVGGGHIPVNISIELANKIPKTAVAIHRIKDNSLINLLLTGAWRP